MWAGLLALALVAMWLFRFRNRNEFTQPRKDSVRPVLPPGNGAPVFSGLRVVELGTVIAIPSATRMLGELGADVIKIEAPSGDPWRKFLLPLERGRSFSAAFEAANGSKRSIVLDLKKPEQCEKARKLISEADVFVTNMRSDALSRLGLGFEVLRSRMSGLVIVSVTGWGNRGPDSSRPGYDIGSFWTGTGLAATLHQQGAYSMLPIGFGDLATSSLVLSAVSAGVSRRILTGNGSHFAISLYGVGVWCTSPSLVSLSQHDIDAASKRTIPDYDLAVSRSKSPHPLFESYKTRDDIFVGFQFKQSELENAENELRKKWLGVDSFGSLNEHLSRNLEKEVFADLLKRFESFSYVRLAKMVELKEITESEGTSLGKKLADSNCLTSFPGVRDISAFINLPFKFSCSSSHGPQDRAAVLGQHSRDFSEGNLGWWKRPKSCELFQENSQRSCSKLPFEGIHVLEFDEIDCSVCAAASTLLMTLGVTVTVLRSSSSELTGFAKYLDKNKKIVFLESFSFSELSKIQIFITSRSKDRLLAFGLDYDTWKKRFPRLVYCSCTAFGWHFTSEDENLKAEVVSWYFTSGLASVFAGRAPSRPPELPQHFGDLICACHFSGAISTGIMHMIRTGEGQFVETNFLSCAMWNLSQTFSILKKDLSKLFVAQQSPKDLQICCPVPSANGFRTKDGMWIQMMGVEVGRHLPRLIRCLGVSGQVCQSVGYALCFQVARKFVTEKTSLLKILPVIKAINRVLAKKIGNMDWEQVQDLFSKWNIWHTPVRTPESVFVSEQALALNLLYRDRQGNILVRTPIDLET